MKKVLYITLICIVGLALFLSYQKSLFNSSFQHIIDDKFVSEYSEKMLHFYFIQVSEYDKAEMIKISENILNKIYQDGSSNNSILICYFYQEIEETEMPEMQQKVIKKIYPNKKNLINKLSYYKNAFIYTASASKNAILFRGQKINSGQLSKSNIIIPKKGTNAYFILFGAD